jgi:curved DNA-binding protein CbpA
VKKLYRQLAQKIHPDRAQDDADRAWRTELMAEANRAYRSGDHDALKGILAAWHESVRSETCSNTNNRTTRDARSALMRRVMRLRRRIAEIEAELNQIYGSRLYELFAAAKIARRQGRDLMQEMAEKLDGQIADIKAAINAAGETVL